MITIDQENGIVTTIVEGREEHHSIGSPAAFEILSRLWLRCGWDLKYVYSFTWMGRPIIQLPEDVLRIQEIIYTVRPDVIIETGVAHGGSLALYATLCKSIGRGRVIGIDIEIRSHNRAALESHELFPLITLIEGNSADEEVIGHVRSLIRPSEIVFVMLDSNHTRSHVMKELEAYAPLVTVGSYIVVADGIMKDLTGAPRSAPDWASNNPERAALDFVETHPDFVIEEPTFRFNEGAITQRVTYWPNAFLRRCSAEPG